MTIKKREPRGKNSKNREVARAGDEKLENIAAARQEYFASPGSAWREFLKEERILWNGRDVEENLQKLEQKVYEYALNGMTKKDICKKFGIAVLDFDNVLLDAYEAGEFERKLQLRQMTIEAGLETGAQATVARIFAAKALGELCEYKPPVEVTEEVKTDNTNSPTFILNVIEPPKKNEQEQAPDAAEE